MRIPSQEGMGTAAPQVNTVAAPRRSTAGSDALARLSQIGADAAQVIDQNNKSIQVAESVSQSEKAIAEFGLSLKNDTQFGTHETRFNDFVKDVNSGIKKSLGGDQRLFDRYKTAVDSTVFNAGLKIKSRSMDGALKQNITRLETLTTEQSSLIANALIAGDSEEAAKQEVRARGFYERSFDDGILAEKERDKLNNRLTKEISLTEINLDFGSKPQNVVEKIEAGAYKGVKGKDRAIWLNKAKTKVIQLSEKKKSDRKIISNELVSDTRLALDNGYVVSTEELILARLAAQDVGKVEELENAVAASEFILLPKNVRDHLPNTIEGVDKAELRNKLEKTNGIVEVEVSKDGYSFGLRQGLIDKVDIDLQNPATIKARIKQAEYLTKHYGAPVSPLSKDEASILSRSLPNMTAQEKTQLALTLGDSDAVWPQLDKSNAGLFAMTGAIGDRNIMENVFRGEKLIADKLVHPLKRNDYLGDFDDYVGGVYGGEDRKQILKAALAHYAGSTRNNAYDSGDFEDSIEAVTGGVVKINGSKVELPRDVSEDDFDDYIDDFSPAMVEQFGAVLGHSAEQASEVIQKSQLISVGNNRYQVSPDGVSVLVNFHTGQPFEIGFDQALFRQQASDQKYRRHNR